MGYEIKLIIGKSGHPNKELARKEEAEFDGEVAWFPYKKDDKGNSIETGRTEIYFQMYGLVELCKPGYDSHLLKLDRINKEAKNVCWYFYHTDGNTEVKEDCYGDVFKPVPVADVIEALEKDLEASLREYSDGKGYRRFRWALGFLRSVDEDSEVLLYGH